MNFIANKIGFCQKRNFLTFSTNLWLEIQQWNTPSQFHQLGARCKLTNSRLFLLIFFIVVIYKTTKFLKFSPCAELVKLSHCHNKVRSCYCTYDQANAIIKNYRVHIDIARIISISQENLIQYWYLISYRSCFRYSISYQNVSKTIENYRSKRYLYQTFIDQYDTFLDIRYPNTKIWSICFDKSIKNYRSFYRNPVHDW